MQTLSQKLITNNLAGVRIQHNTGTSGSQVNIRLVQQGLAKVLNNITLKKYLKKGYLVEQKIIFTNLLRICTTWLYNSLKQVFFSKDRRCKLILVCYLKWQWNYNKHSYS